jgi:Peptidase propeptide and YPEB domain
LAPEPVTSQAVDERPIRVRLEPQPEVEYRKASRISPRAVLAVVALFAVTLVAAQTCQQSQIRLSKEQAVEKARPEAGFAAERTQVRLVRQGLNGHPFWAVSFSVPARDGDGYSKLTTVRVDANTGKVESVNREQ